MLVVDLETTGLSADSEVPLEAGFIIVDKYGNEKDHMDFLIWEDTDQYKNAWTGMIDFVKDMHQKNGLSADLFSGRPLWTRRAVALAAMNWVYEMGYDKGELPIMGSSIGSLDRPFLIKHFDFLNEFLSYRNIDVSTLKEIAKRFRPDLYNYYEKNYPKESAVHRVLEDCRSSIHQYQYYLSSFTQSGI